MAKFILMNNGGFNGLDDVRFPVEVMGTLSGQRVSVSTDELIRVGADPIVFMCSDAWSFKLGTEAIDPSPKRFRLIASPYHGTRTEIKFPVEVIGTQTQLNAVMVSTEELVRVGATRDMLKNHPDWAFMIGQHIEVI